jgi:hypothetical protein
MFDILFALERCGYRFVRFKVHQRLYAISLGETIDQPFTMLVNTPHQVVRHADI